jgi:hypothetical protein
MRDGVERAATLLTSSSAPAPALPAVTTGGAGGISGAESTTPLQGAVAGESATSPPADDAPLLARGMRALPDPVREGFNLGLRGEREIAEGISDSRLMIQLGMGLGCIYAAFLSGWFWATRVRRNLR